MYEMSAGYELTCLRPAMTQYKTINRKLKPILEYIFEEGFPHNIHEV